MTARTAPDFPGLMLLLPTLFDMNIKGFQLFTYYAN